ncbi:hypothetical protein N431DRAFT_437078 [Stipitochalara longipes BDJ]|nr:hypothetical protein N431DRAFT_437078 [Stipitochalara longipes BDJ]
MAAAARAPQGGGSGQTQMQNPAQGGAGPAVSAPAPRQAVLHLRGATREEEREEQVERRGITWAEDVVDNEGMGKKSSKVCCIYHAPKGIDESSDESSSDSSSDSDSGDDGSARPARKQGLGNGRGHGHNHNHNHDHGKGQGKGKGKARARSPNAYEKVPKPKGGGAKDMR